jgi:hypothetical protein
LFCSCCCCFHRNTQTVRLITPMAERFHHQ